MAPEVVGSNPIFHPQEQPDDESHPVFLYTGMPCKLACKRQPVYKKDVRQHIWLLLKGPPRQAAMGMRSPSGRAQSLLGGPIRLRGNAGGPIPPLSGKPSPSIPLCAQNRHFQHSVTSLCAEKAVSSHKAPFGASLCALNEVFLHSARRLCAEKDGFLHNLWRAFCTPSPIQSNP